MPGGIRSRPCSARTAVFTRDTATSEITKTGRRFIRFRFSQEHERQKVRWRRRDDRVRFKETVVQVYGGGMLMEVFPREIRGYTTRRGWEFGSVTVCFRLVKN